MTSESKRPVASSPSPEEIEALFQAIADPETREITSLLRGWGKKSLNILNGDGDTPLLAAINARKSTIIAQLLNSGADGTQVGKLNEPPIFVAVRTGAATIVSQLITALKRPCLTALNPEGNTVLHVAAAESMTVIVTVLLRIPAIDLTPLNHAGKTPADIAAKPAIAKLITDAIALRASRSNSALTPTSGYSPKFHSPAGKPDDPTGETNKNDEKVQTLMLSR